MTKQEIKPTLPKDFDGIVYLELHPDVAAAGVDPAEHYINYGFKERRPYQKSDLTTELAKYSHLAPEPINAFELFGKTWSTRYVSSSGEPLTSGVFPGTEDSRIQWLIDRVNFKKTKVLELGPLEGGHSMMLEKQGADVTAVEANIGAFLRCLVVKNQYNLKAKFLLGDFTKMDFSKARYDLVLASGVLYHMPDPVALLVDLSKVTDKIFLWTHYFEEDLTLWHHTLADSLANGRWNYKEPEVVDYKGLKVNIIKQRYGEALGWDGFCGGPEEYSYWVVKDDLLALLKKVGFKKVEVTFDEVGHQNGPSFCVFAEK